MGAVAQHWRLLLTVSRALCSLVLLTWQAVSCAGTQDVGLSFLGDTLNCPGSLAGFQAAVADVNAEPFFLANRTVIPVVAPPHSSDQAGGALSLMLANVEGGGGGGSLGGVVGGCGADATRSIARVARAAGLAHVAFVPLPRALRRANALNHDGTAQLGPPSVTVAPRSVEGLLMVLLAERFQWRRLAVVHSDEAFAVALADQLEAALLARGSALRRQTDHRDQKPGQGRLCNLQRIVMTSSPPPRSTGDGEYDAAADRAAAAVVAAMPLEGHGGEQEPDPRTVVVLMGPSAYRRWSVAAPRHAIGRSGGGWVIMGSGWLAELDGNSSSRGVAVDDGGLVFIPTVLPPASASPSSIPMNATRTSADGIPLERWAARFRRLPVGAHGRTAQEDGLARLAYDAVWLWARGLDAVLRNATRGISTSGAPGRTTGGNSSDGIVNAILSDRSGFVGASGLVLMCDAECAHGPQQAAPAAVFGYPVGYGDRKEDVAVLHAPRPGWMLVNVRGGHAEPVRSVTLRQPEASFSAMRLDWQQDEGNTSASASDADSIEALFPNVVWPGGEAVGALARVGPRVTTYEGVSPCTSVYRSSGAVWGFEVALVALSCILAVVFPAYFSFKRDHPLLQFGFGPFRYVMNAGAVLASVSYLVTAVPTHHGNLTGAHCGAYICLSSLAFVLTFGTLVVQTARMKHVFLSTRNEGADQFPTRKALKWVLILATFDILVSAAFLLSAPAQAVGMHLEGNAVAVYCTQRDGLKTILIWYKLPVLLWGARLAVQTRKIFAGGGGFSESTWVAASIWTALLCLFLGIPVRYMKWAGDTYTTFFSFILLAPYIMTQVNSAVPRIVAIMNYNAETEGGGADTNHSKRQGYAAHGGSDGAGTRLASNHPGRVGVQQHVHWNGRQVELNRFIMSIEWANVRQVEQAKAVVDSLGRQVAAENMDWDVGLRLLSHDVLHTWVRQLAVVSLSEMGDEWLCLCLFQLVEALGHEEHSLTGKHQHRHAFFHANTIPLGKQKKARKQKKALSRSRSLSSERAAEQEEVSDKDAAHVPVLGLPVPSIERSPHGRPAALTSERGWGRSVSRSVAAPRVGSAHDKPEGSAATDEAQEETPSQERQASTTCSPVRPPSEKNKAGGLEPSSDSSAPLFTAASKGSSGSKIWEMIDQQVLREERPSSAAGDLGVGAHMHRLLGGSSLAGFLFLRAVQSPEAATFLFWHIYTSIQTSLNEKVRYNVQSGVPIESTSAATPSSEGGRATDAGEVAAPVLLHAALQGAILDDSLGVARWSGKERLACLDEQYKLTEKLGALWLVATHKISERDDELLDEISARSLKQMLLNEHKSGVKAPAAVGGGVLRPLDDPPMALLTPRTQSVVARHQTDGSRSTFLTRYIQSNWAHFQFDSVVPVEPSIKVHAIHPETVCLFKSKCVPMSVELLTQAGLSEFMSTQDQDAAACSSIPEHSTDFWADKELARDDARSWSFNPLLSLSTEGHTMQQGGASRSSGAKAGAGATKAGAGPPISRNAGEEGTTAHVALSVDCDTKDGSASEATLAGTRAGNNSGVHRRPGGSASTDSRATNMHAPPTGDSYQSARTRDVPSITYMKPARTVKQYVVQVKILRLRRLSNSSKKYQSMRVRVEAGFVNHADPTKHSGKGNEGMVLGNQMVVWDPRSQAEAVWPAATSSAAASAGEGLMEFVMGAPPPRMGLAVFGKTGMFSREKALWSGTAEIRHDQYGQWTGPTWYPVGVADDTTKKRTGFDESGMVLWGELQIDVCVQVLDSSSESRNRTTPEVAETSRPSKTLAALKGHVRKLARRGGSWSEHQGVPTCPKTSGGAAAPALQKRASWSPHGKHKHSGAVEPGEAKAASVLETMWENAVAPPTGATRKRVAQSARRLSARVTSWFRTEESASELVASGPEGPKLLPIPKSVVVLFKNGDDLRQDHLVCQLIAVIDRLWKDAGLDLKLLQYRVTSTGWKRGLIEFVSRSKPLSGVLSQYGSAGIQGYFRENHHDAKAKYGIDSVVMDNFVRSCAGYCIVTYILGIGDRHFDNILIQSDGFLFHIDFGFIFGADPKPSPAPIRFTEDMVKAMGGNQSREYQLFTAYCSQAFNVLRSHSRFLLNFLYPILGTNLPHLHRDPMKTIRFVQGNFQLGLSDAQAKAYIVGLLEQSRKMLMPGLMERMHRVAIAIKH